MAVETGIDIDPASLATPAICVNRFQLIVTGSTPTIRIGFAEGAEGKHFQYRTAVAMTASDAQELADAIIATLKVHSAKKNG